MDVGYFIIAFLVVITSLFALILTFRGYDWAIDKFEHLLYATDFPDKLGDKISRRILKTEQAKKVEESPLD